MICSQLKQAQQKKLITIDGQALETLLIRARNSSVVEISSRKLDQT